MLRTTAKSHSRIMVLEVMGRYAGWIALSAAIAGGADACLIPEIDYDLEKVKEKIMKNQENGKNYTLVVVSEGAKEKGGQIITKDNTTFIKGLDNIKLGGAGEYVAKKLEELTGITSRNTTLGYIQRGGSPIAEDRILSTMYGAKAVKYLLEGKKNILVTFSKGEISYVSLEEVVGANKEIGAASGNNKHSNIRVIPEDHFLISTAREIGITFGD